MNSYIVLKPENSEYPWITMATGADRGRGEIGSKTYQPSAPAPPELTRQCRLVSSLPPGPLEGWAG
jgi:hypothetical protein